MMFVGSVNSAQVHYSHRKSTFTAKKTKLKTQTQNANHPNPNTTLVKEI